MRNEKVSVENLSEYAETHTIEEASAEFGLSVVMLYRLSRQNQFAFKKRNKNEEIFSYILANYKTKSIYEMADEYNCAVSKIRSCCYTLGVKPVRKNVNRSQCLDRDAMVVVLVKAGFTYENIAKVMGVTRQRIEQIVRKADDGD